MNENNEQPSEIEPEAAIELIQKSRLAMAERLVTPWWLDLMFAVPIGALVVSSGASSVARGAVVPMSLALIVTYALWGRRLTGLWVSGLWVSGLRTSGWSAWLQVLLAAAVASLTGGAVLLERKFGVTGATMIAGAAAVIIAFSYARIWPLVHLAEQYRSMK